MPTSTSTPTSYDLDISTTIGWWGFTKHDASRALAVAPKGEVHVRLSSLGGSLEDGLDIRRRLADHGRVVVHIVGMTASAATVLAMGAQRIVMSRGAALLIHNCSLFVSSWGSKNKEEVDEEMDRLRAVHGTLATLDAVMAGIYAARTGRPEAEMAALMSENLWLTVTEALALGLVDEVADDLVPSPAAADTEPSPLEAVAALGLPPLRPEPQAAAPEGAAPLPAAPEADTPSLLRSLLAAVRELGAKAAAAFATAAPAAHPTPAAEPQAPAPLTEPQPTNFSTPMNTPSASKPSPRPMPQAPSLSPRPRSPPSTSASPLRPPSPPSATPSRPRRPNSPPSSRPPPTSAPRSKSASPSSKPPTARTPPRP